MKYLVTLLLTLVIYAASGQNRTPKEIGIGFVISSNPYQFENASHSDDLYTNPGLTKKRIHENVFPFFYKPDYGLYHFICLKKTTAYYEVLVNDTEIAYIPNNMNFYFKTWDAVLLQAAVERLTKNNLIRKELGDKSEVVQNNCDFDRLTVEDIVEKNGEHWLFVSFSPKCEYYPNKNTQLKYGWVKWKNQGKLLVNILLLC